MLSQKEFVTLSLELHLFFARIMKEHALFIELGFMSKDINLSKRSNNFKAMFEEILWDVVNLSNGNIRKKVLLSDEIVTDFTIAAEQKTERLTGIFINQGITRKELKLVSENGIPIPPILLIKVKRINNDALNLIQKFIEFKQSLLDDILKCNMFTTNYPLFTEHDLKEAKLYHKLLTDIKDDKHIDSTNIKHTELFWDQIMIEHASFMRGLLDPTEGELIRISNDFVHDFSVLLKNAKNATDETIDGITHTTIKETIKLRDFKQSATIGITDCKIRAVILPLLADHILREANHYIRLLDH